MEMFFKTISASEAYPCRRMVLRENKGPIEVPFQGDDDEDSIHFAAVIGGNIVAVLSALPIKKHQYQFRGMAVLQDYQANNIGKKLLQYAEIHLIGKDCESIFLNAREKAVGFYLKNNYLIQGDAFEIKGIGTHYFMIKINKIANQ